MHPTNSFALLTEHRDVAPSPSSQPQPQPQPLQSEPTSIPSGPTAQATSLPTPPAADDSPEALRAQQEYLRALLRANPSEQQSQQEVDQDPMMKLLSSMLGGIPGAENTAPGSGMAPPAQGDPKVNDLLSSLGVPPLLSSMLLGGSSQQTPAEKQREWVLKLLHTLFALLIGAYLVFLVNSAVATYGGNPPPPATAQSPFVIFLTAELLLSGARVFWGQSQQGTLSTGIQLLKSVMRDGSLVVFALGVGSWWNGGWQTSGAQ